MVTEKELEKFGDLLGLLIAHLSQFLNLVLPEKTHLAASRSALEHDVFVGNNSSCLRVLEQSEQFIIVFELLSDVINYSHFDVLGVDLQSFQEIPQLVELLLSQEQVNDPLG